MNFRDAVGQHFLVDVPGPEITPGVERLVREGRIGGVILFAKNIRSISQVRGLTADLQRLSFAAGLPPLLISVDQEGGMVNRFTEDVTVFPGPMGVAAAGRTEDAAVAGRMTALELRALGINVNHAPVLDVNTETANPIIGVRAFSDDPATVARLGRAYVAAAQEAGILATPKHFPGHGATVVDSHLDLPRVDKDSARLRREDIEPFAAAVASGADGLLTAHVVYPGLDPDLPATLSPAIVTGLLRGELGFNGVAFTDSMDMKAISARWGRGPAATAALAAGVDVIMACGSAAAQWESIAAVQAAVESGALDTAALERSAARIAGVKARYAGGAASPAPFERAIHQAAAQQIADRAVTLVRNDAGAIPVRAGRTAVLHVGSDVWVTAPAQLGEELAALTPGVATAAAASEVGGSPWDSVVVVSLSWRSYEGAGTILALHREFGDRLIVVGAGNPYELLRFPHVRTYLAAYGPDLPSMRAAAKVLAGQLEPRGRLPVALPPLYPRGYAVR
ncbi:MAG TPA: beta-N-acetylhexosaminidase [bacterium]